MARSRTTLKRTPAKDKRHDLAEARDTDDARPSKLHDSVAVTLGKEIATGLIAEGALLPIELEGVARFDVSRTTYREAIRTLASKGMVTSRSKTGTRVNPRSEWAMLDPQVISWMFSGQPSKSEVGGLFELRMIIEPAAAALAAERRSAEQLLAIGRAFEEMSGQGLQTERGRKADGLFHALILQATGNEFLIGLTESIATAVRWTTIIKTSAVAPPRDPMPLHFELYRAIADRNPDEARVAALALLLQAKEDTETLLE
jgi:DNA-binding FadR family transcriptional regulator